ncbi:hypothetical protein SAMN04489760_12720 [Syntrophus gentianae]|uniref:Lipoprotein n=1 Tax=Syntrophus gentianae TaxID=43775 RepID=A0A1H7ZVR1_9BACT|nr:hypothetical protein [Syntrophus gentianae]SEM61834.1 hypothetical protein SAMN04489760_12720 [Syntrophus gentianae]
MKRYLGLICCCLLLLCGCAAQSIPEWRTDSFNSLEKYKDEFLAGKEHLAEVHFQKAVDEIKSSGDLTLLMTAHLTRSALQIAVLETPDFRNYLEIAKADPADADEQKNYYLLLEGKFDSLQKDKLPKPYQDLAEVLEKGDQKEISQVVGEIQDDLSRLIATGLAVRNGREDEALLTGAVDLASSHGWRKPLLIYLNRLKSYYRENQNWEKEEKIRLKMELLTPHSGMRGKTGPAC